jgi:hypothetical protein
MTDKTQFEKFKALAEEAECDTNEKKFDKSLKTIAKSPPPKNDTKTKKAVSEPDAQ